MLVDCVANHANQNQMLLMEMLKPVYIKKKEVMARPTTWVQLDDPALEE